MNELIQQLMHYAAGAWDAIQVVLVFLVPMLAVELVRPARRLHLGTVVFNLCYAPIYLTVSAAVLDPVARQISPWIPANMLGWSIRDASTEAVVALVLAYLMAFDFFYYWFHRLQHRWRWMWRFHRFHHADSNVSISSATRHHWMEEALRYFVMSMPLLLLFGSPERTFTWLGVLTGVLGLFIHWNVPIGLGKFSAVLVGPQYHRLHHSIEPHHYDKNFAVIFPFWDRLFGTQHLPQRGEFPVTGLTDAGGPNGLVLLSPLPPYSG